VKGGTSAIRRVHETGSRVDDQLLPLILTGDVGIA